MAKIKHYIYTKKKQPIYRFFTGVMKLFLHKPQIINLNDEIPTEGLLVGPHMGKWGPFYLSQYFPTKIAVIGAHPMLGSYKERWKYLRNVLYIQKQHRGKVFSTIKATFEAVFSKFMYKGMHVIPSYEDMRLLHTVHDVAGTMNNGLPVIIFPENSDLGYQRVLNQVHGGYITVAKFVGIKREKETPIYPFYVHVKRRIIVIGKPYFLSELKGKDNSEINKITCDRINELNPFLKEDRKLNPII